MVLRKERPLCRVENVSNNEQPVSKRQRVEDLNGVPIPADQVPSTIDTPNLSECKSNKNLIDDDLAVLPSLEKDEPDHVAIRASGQDRLGFIDNVKINTFVRPAQYEDYWKPFHSNLLSQCLCGVDDEVLRRPFHSHYELPVYSWPHSQLVSYLSNLQFLFEIYFKQCRLRKVCSRIKDICDSLKTSESTLISEIIELSTHPNKYVQYLAGRVISAFLVIAQDNSPEIDTYGCSDDSPPGSPQQDTLSESSLSICDEWLEKLIDNLHTVDELDEVTTRKISFCLEVFRQLLEWKDVEIHPLDDDSDDEAEEEILSPIEQQPIESNYFNFYSEHGTDQISIGQNSTGITTGTLKNALVNSSLTSTSSASSGESPSSVQSSSGLDGSICQFFWHYECFNTIKLKLNTVKYLESKWQTLFQHIIDLNVTSGPNAKCYENLILSFLELWKIIISGAGGKESFLSITDTIPFYAQLDSFRIDGLNQDLPPRIYMQHLELFNAVLCYGDSLALQEQDNFPDKTCNLANRIINHVKVNSPRSLLNSVPIRIMDNPVGLIGYVGRTVDSTMRHPENYGRLGNRLHSSDSASHCIDKRYMQNMVLLVLKSVAVSVRVMRSDSSDSSIDSNDAQAYAEYRTIARTMRHVLKKLDVFAKETLQLLPDHHFSKTLVKLFIDQDDFLVEAMICTLDVAIAFTIRSNRGDEPAFDQLNRLLDPVYIFLEFLNATAKSWGLLLNYLIGNETCFLLYFFRLLKYITKNWWHFEQRCREFGEVYGMRNVCGEVMAVLHDLRLEIDRKLEIGKIFVRIKKLLETCESLHEGIL